MPTQMTDRTLHIAKGLNSIDTLDFTAALSSTISSGSLPVPAGAVVSLNSSGELILGVGNTKVMPLFMFNSSDDPAASSDGGDPATTVGGWHSFMPPQGGHVRTLPAIGGHELVSTAYVTGQSYPPNTPLTANLAAGANPGMLRPGTMGTNMIVGIVSRGLVNNGYGKTALAFWAVPVFP
jgi:hypothetical protein